MSFDLRSPYVSGGHFADSMGDASISTYFQKKSHSLGQPFSGKLPPEDRVREEAHIVLLLLLLVAMLMLFQSLS